MKVVQGPCKVTVCYISKVGGQRGHGVFHVSQEVVICWSQNFPGVCRNPSCPEKCTVCRACASSPQEGPIRGATKGRMPERFLSQGGATGQYTLPDRGGDKSQRLLLQERKQVMDMGQMFIHKENARDKEWFLSHVLVCLKYFFSNTFTSIWYMTLIT